MDLRRLLRQWIVIEHVEQTGPPDDMGDPTELRTYSRVRGYVWQTNATEVTANTQVERETWHVALHRSAAGTVAAHDRIIQDGELSALGALVPNVGEIFEVAGPPWIARNPRTDAVEYVQARLERSS